MRFLPYLLLAIGAAIEIAAVVQAQRRQKELKLKWAILGIVIFCGALAGLAFQAGGLVGR